MKRAIMSFVMVFILMFGFCCIPKMAEGDSNLGTSGLYYSPVVGGYLVCGYEGIDADIIIPDTYIDGDVIGFVEHAFESSQINSVTMGANIKEISDDLYLLVAKARCKGISKETLHQLVDEHYGKRNG